MSFFILALPVLLQLLVFASVQNIQRSRTRFTCLSESLRLVKSGGDIRAPAAVLAKKISGEIIVCPSFVRSGPNPSPTALVYRLKDGSLCGAELRKKEEKWDYRLIYHGTAKARF